MCLLLVEHGADFSACDRWGHTCLSEAEAKHADILPPLTAALAEREEVRRKVYSSAQALLAAAGIASRMGPAPETAGARKAPVAPVRATKLSETAAEVFLAKKRAREAAEAAEEARSRRGAGLGEGSRMGASEQARRVTGASAAADSSTAGAQHGAADGAAAAGAEDGPRAPKPGVSFSGSAAADAAVGSVRGSSQRGPRSTTRDILRGIILQTRAQNARDSAASEGSLGGGGGGGSGGRGSLDGAQSTARATVIPIRQAPLPTPGARAAPPAAASLAAQAGPDAAGSGSGDTPKASGIIVDDWLTSAAPGDSVRGGTEGLRRQPEELASIRVRRATPAALTLPLSSVFAPVSPSLAL